MLKDALEWESQKGTILRTPLWGLVPAMGVTVCPNAPGPAIQLHVDMHRAQIPPPPCGWEWLCVV